MMANTQSSIIVINNESEIYGDVYLLLESQKWKKCFKWKDLI